MKLTLSLVALCLFSAPSFASDAHSNAICGTLKVKKVMCVRAPCNPLMKLITADGEVSLSTQDEDLLEGLIRQHNRNLCVDGEMNEHGTFIVNDVNVQ